MALNRKLQSFPGIPKIKVFSKLLDKIEADLRELNIVDLHAEILEKKKEGSALKRFLSFRVTDMWDPDQIMVVSGTAMSRPFMVIIPLRKGGTLPYFVEIDLNASPGETLEFRKGFAGGKWVLEQDNKKKRDRLSRLKLPGIGWTHARTGMKFDILTAHQIIPDEDNGSTSMWIIHSGYQGFLFNVGPKVSKYLKAARDVEYFLNSWAEKVTGR